MQALEQPAVGLAQRARRRHLVADPEIAVVGLIAGRGVEVPAFA